MKLGVMIPVSEELLRDVPAHRTALASVMLDALDELLFEFRFREPLLSARQEREILEFGERVRWDRRYAPDDFICEHCGGDL